MPPESKVKKRGRTVKRQSTSPKPTADYEVEEQSMKDLMKNMGTMHNSLNTRMGMMASTAVSHAMYMAPSN